MLTNLHDVNVNMNDSVRPRNTCVSSGPTERKLKRDFPNSRNENRPLCPRECFTVNQIYHDNVYMNKHTHILVYTPLERTTPPKDYTVT